ncbi:hypothetical protein OU995_05630 [Roseateles sp. SL47]|jgi:hypothetical protein|uniref:hypothetical protein n=1 Tax=Roseateles sp. SL47 TaxID=2995138 RepID=UPI00226FA031|nr:hypothetical protein [Roseateles sp. SL47]WAC74206.1 hypothetical protein OU995_05630 [Roseateles sp. SL47]
MQPHASSSRPRLTLTPVAASLFLLMAGCAPLPPKTVVREVRVEVPVQVPTVSPADAAARHLLAYHDRIRQMGTAELAQELLPRDDANLPAATAVPLALALMTNHAPGELARAQNLLEQVLRQPDTGDWKPLAQLLLDRLVEQRRLEDQADKLNQQRASLQQRLDQANQKLEALKAIERSLVAPRPGAPSPAASAPASGASK